MKRPASIVHSCLPATACRPVPDIQNAVLEGAYWMFAVLSFMSVTAAGRHCRNRIVPTEEWLRPVAGLAGAARNERKDSRRTPG